MKVDVPNDNSQLATPIILSIKGDSKEFMPNEDVPLTLIQDGRAVLQSSGSSEQADGNQLAASTFDKKGFCCLSHTTKVTKWNESFLKGMIFGSQISRVYAHEVEDIIRNILLPNYEIIEVDRPPAVLRRGPGSKNKDVYGSGVHQDYGVTFLDYTNNVEIQKKWESEEVKGMMVINFWRPIGGYTDDNPMMYKPLALCDPATVHMSDTVHVGYKAELFGGVKGKTTDQMTLKNNPNHKWYYYPRMTDDEVLVFKQIEVWKDDLEPREEFPIRGCFHAAIDDVITPEDTEPRRSTECRVLVYLGEKKDVHDTNPWTPPSSKPACIIS